jgi:hypothetical protein
MALGGCPLCRLSAHTSAIYIESLNYERVNDIKTRAGLDASRGLCERHTRRWEAAQGCALGVAIVYRAAIHNLLRETEPLPSSGWNFFRRRGGPGAAALSHMLESQGPCPACTLEAETTQRYSEVLLKDVADADFQEVFLAAGGLCLPHLRTVLLQGPESSAGRLVELQRQAWLNLESELDEFIRKNDYRFQGEAMGEEADSWKRAAHRLVGEPD